MTIAIYPGSFDPVTYGHLDIITRSSEIFEKVIVGVMINPKKNYLFSLEERKELIVQSLKEYTDNTNIEVVSFDGLLVNYMKKHNIRAIVKGLRTMTDYEYEFQMALLNKRLFSHSETFFIPSSEKYSLVSSSMVKELYSFEGNIEEFVPSVVEKALAKKI